MVSYILFFNSHYHKKDQAYQKVVSNLFEKTSKNSSYAIVNSTKKAVESKSLIAGKIIVGFE